MQKNSDNGASYQFGAFELRAQPATLTLNGEVVALPSQPLRLLLELVSRQGDIVTHAEIHTLLWPDQNIDATGRMHACVRQIRRALDDNNGAPQFLETVPRVGYRFVGELRNAERKVQRPAEKLRPSTMLWPILFVAAGVILVSVWWLADDTGQAELASLPASSTDPFLRGRELLAIGAYRAAQESLAAAVSSNPDFAPAHAALAEAELSLDNVADARRLAERAIALDATYSRGYLQRARIAGWVDHNWAAAERALDRALELTPDAPDIRLALAELYLLTGRPDDSIAAVDTLAPRTQLPPHLLAAAGRLNRLQGRDNEGELLCRQALQRDSRLAAGHECLYRVALVRRNPEDARSIVPGFASALGATGKTIESFASEDAVAELMAFERWRSQQISNDDPVTMAYTNIVLQQYDEAMYLLEKARDQQSPRLPAALHDLFFVGLFHQSAYAELADSIGVVAP